VPLRRRLAGVLAAAALVPPLFWLGPALARRLAPSFRDQGDFFYPLKLYTADRLRSGEIPLWNPLSGAGEPWLANGQAGVFYPPTLFFLLPSPAAAAILFLLVHFAIAAWGMRRFLAQEGASESAALFGSAVFAASGFAASLSTFWNHFGAWAYLPGIAAVARSGVKSRGALLGLSLLFGLQAMAGSPEISGLTLVIALALSLLPRRHPEKPWLDSRPRSFRRAAGGIFLGLALAAWVVVPMGELVINSDRRGPLPAAEREPGAIPIPALAAAFLRPPSAVRTYWLPSLFVGPLALAVAAAAFFERERRALAILFAAIAIGGVLVAAAGPPGSWLRSIPLLDRLRYPEKGLAASVFALAALGGLGLDTLRFRAGSRILRVAFPAFAAAALLLTLAAPSSPELRASVAIGFFPAVALALGGGRREAAGGFLAGFAALALLVSYGIANRPLFTFAPEAAVPRRSMQSIIWPDACSPRRRRLFCPGWCATRASTRPHSSANARRSRATRTSSSAWRPCGLQRRFQPPAGARSWTRLIPRPTRSARRVRRVRGSSGVRFVPVPSRRARLETSSARHSRRTGRASPSCEVIASRQTHFGPGTERPRGRSTSRGRFSSIGILLRDLPWVTARRSSSRDSPRTSRSVSSPRSPRTRRGCSS
jgi:hypothetical protein